MRVLGSGTNEGSSPRSGCGRPPSLVPSHPRITRGFIARRSSLGEFICVGITVVPLYDVLRHDVLTHNLQDFLIPGAI